MKIGIFIPLFDDKPLEEVLKYVSKLGYETVEIGAWRSSHHIDIDKILTGGATAYKTTIKRYGLSISALNNAIEGALVLGPHDSATDEFYKGTPEEKVKYGMDRMKKTAEAAAALDVPVVSGFIGVAVGWGAFYVWPPKYEQIFEEGYKVFAERWGEILDHFQAHGIKFAHEVHPHQQAYNIETAEQALKVINRSNFGFNFDPSHLFWQGIDPVVFIKKFGDRIYHMHAKDGELVKENIATSGCIPTGSWRRPTRGFRFRTVGWGDIPWRRIITALTEVGYNYVMSVEHEDSTMSREDGCEKAIAFLKPLIIKAPLEKYPGRLW